MISNLQTNERANRSHPSCGAAMRPRKIASACFNSVTKRDQLVARLRSHSRPKRCLGNAALRGGALRRSVLFSQPQISGGVTPAVWLAELSGAPSSAGKAGRHTPCRNEQRPRRAVGSQQTWQRRIAALCFSVG